MSIPGTEDLRQMPEAERGEDNSPAYLPYQFINCSLPYRRVEDGYWERKNGQLTMIMNAGSFKNPDGTTEVMLPYGKYARAILLFLCSKAHQTTNPRIVIDSSYRGFLEQLGITWKSASAREAVKQLRALTATQIVITETWPDENGRKTLTERRFTLGFKAHLVFDDDELDESGESWVMLSDEFFGSLIQEHSIPILHRAWTHLINTSKSPMALDVYTWLACRLHGSIGNSRVTWNQLHEQFGSTTGDLADFKPKFRKALDTALEVYPEANITEVKGANRKAGFRGFLLQQSPAAMETSWPLS